MAELASPPNSLPSSPSFQASRSRPSLSLDLSKMPSAKTITPSNTLLITQLHNPIVFQPISLDQIRGQIHTAARLNSFSPLPSLRRIICSFHSTTDAIAIRALLESNQLLPDMQTRVYFGEPTPILGEDEIHQPKRLLKAPQLDIDLVLSPPASPPHAWMDHDSPMDLPASDLAKALSVLKTDQDQFSHTADPATPNSVSSDAPLRSRSRSSTMLFDPECGTSPGLPAVMVEDMGFPGVDMDIDESPIAISVDRMSL
ncbi:hypothetical protein N7492_009134 [Penicillium capsulatum]|uniref:Calcineurin binding protein n=1 Tax=Penicillium capsulatum TaxID=69766 RepID=A0A9W9HRZ0_9EURO|nr:hypothetical protein N7492_009134 [Penicillium capsulatum]KAJ6106533.1 hypothetical protein N7512_010050 [Penicillium capsulatum]